MVNPETEKITQPAPEGLSQRETEIPEPSADLKKEGVSEIPSELPLQSQVTDDSGKPLVQASLQNVTITLPAAIQQLDEWSKGDPENALTWFAVFWIRLIKKALHFGWRVVMKGKEVVNAGRSV